MDKEATCNRCEQRITKCYCKKAIWTFPEPKTKRPGFEFPNAQKR